MAEVRLNIVNREYIVTCRDGEEDHLVKLGEMVDAKAQEAGGSAAGLNESRLLLFAALLLADEVGTLKQTEEAETGHKINDANSKEVEMAADTIEKLAIRIENFAQSLEQLGK